MSVDPIATGAMYAPWPAATAMVKVSSPVPSSSVRALEAREGPVATRAGVFELGGLAAVRPETEAPAWTTVCGGVGLFEGGMSGEA